MTDHQTPSSPYYSAIRAEQEQYGDLKFQDLRGGFEFGLRYLHQVLFSFLNYDFDYMLRMDDDYFFCMHRFLLELPVRPAEPMIHWGWTHCSEGFVRSNEACILFSKDLLQHFLTQDSEQIKCHPSAGQMIGAWTKDLNMTRIFRHDSRLHHATNLVKKPPLRRERNLCSKYIGIHGVYALDMKLLWRHRGTKNAKRIGNLVTNSKFCGVSSGYVWQKFSFPWRLEPKPCIKNPKWNTTIFRTFGGAYAGREKSRKKHL